MGPARCRKRGSAAADGRQYRLRFLGACTQSLERALGAMAYACRGSGVRIGSLAPEVTALPFSSARRSEARTITPVMS